MSAANKKIIINRPNRFEELFNSISDSRNTNESIRTRLTEGALELNKARKIYGIKERMLAEARAQVAKLKLSNHELKVAMVQSMIERDELEAKKRDLQQRLRKMEQDIDSLDRQSDYILDSVEASHQPQDGKS